MLHDVNLFAKARALAQVMQQQQDGAPSAGGWFHAPQQGGDPLHGGMQALAKAYADYQQQQSVQNMQPLATVPPPTITPMIGG